MMTSFSSSAACAERALQNAMARRRYRASIGASRACPGPGGRGHPRPLGDAVLMGRRLAAVASGNSCERQLDRHKGQISDELASCNNLAASPAFRTPGWWPRYPKASRNFARPWWLTRRPATAGRTARRRGRRSPRGRCGFRMIRPPSSRPCEPSRTGARSATCCGHRATPPVGRKGARWRTRRALSGSVCSSDGPAVRRGTLDPQLTNACHFPPYSGWK